MADLSTEYMGLKLANPLMVASCSLSINLDGVIRIADSGIAGSIDTDVVARDGIIRRAAARDIDATIVVARNDVPLTARIATNGVVLAAIGDVDPVFTVSQAVCAIVISTDIVTRDGVAVADDIDPTPGVDRDHVPFTVCVAANGVILRATADVDTVSTVA